MAPGRVQNDALEGPKWTLMTPNGLWNTNGWPRGDHKVAKAAPKRSQMAQLGVRRRLGGAQVAPREPMRRPKFHQDDPKMSQRRAKMATMAQDGRQKGQKQRLGEKHKNVKKVLVFIAKLEIGPSQLGLWMGHFRS